MKLSEELQWRGFWNQTTFTDDKLIDSENFTLYLGTDPSADSLHVGHLAVYMMVVVENAKRYIGQTKKIEIIRSLQTDAGKMMFAKLVAEQKKPVKQKTSVPKKRTNGRSKTSAQHEAELINLVNKQ